MSEALFKFRLYIAGDGPYSAQAIHNLDAICREHLPGQHEIELVDVLLNQARALADGVMLTPLLVKLSPQPVRRIVGTLENIPAFLLSMGLPKPAA
jgi:circadian clock protein KaiB